jgi:hypothetical protein
LEQAYNFIEIKNKFNKKGEPTNLQDLKTEINLQVLIQMLIFSATYLSAVNM